MRLSNTIFNSVTISALIALSSGCGSDPEDNDDTTPADGPGASGTEGDGGGTTGSPASTSSAECDDAFTSIQAPYSPNTSIEDWGGFLADEQGLVFSVIPDPAQASYDADLPPLIMSSDLSGKVQTLFTPTEPTMIGQIYGFGDELYFALGLFTQEIVRMPRAGGEATPVSEDSIWAGPRSDGEKLYYSARRDSFVVVSLDPASGESVTLADRGEVEVAAITVEGDDLYWIEVPDEESDFSLYRLPIAGGEAELLMDLPNTTALDSLRVIDNVVFGATLTADFSVEIHRTEIGQTPQVVEDFGGLPMLITNGAVYYNSGSGLAKNSLSFDDPSIVEGTRGMAIAALASSSSHVYYASGPCIYRTAL